ncbi:MAG: hypothetical protein ACR2OY_06835 [Boseongicola sp.]
MFSIFKKKEPEGPAFEQLIVARLNARVQPIDRGDYFEDPLDEVLKSKGIGEVTGGGTQMADEPDGIEFVDVEIYAKDSSDEVKTTVVSALEGFGAPKGSKLLIDGQDDTPFGKLEGMGLFLNGTDLPDEVYANSDVNETIAKLGELLDDNGEFRGHWEGSRETALYFYGASYDAMVSCVQGYLDEEPSCEKTRVVQIA